ncbi:SDR family NAD(P)-dependent oxidoreductase [Bradyrhizobium sp. STM 3557]|uniref:SDR family NAD(P)-dependent oxidoreductase n=1 Tax=Bradyrhizobium sp. STM 3557 TaxID=578920 RepID=UPI00388F974F
MAIGLAEAGATVIVTARTRDGAGSWPGSLDETIAAIEAAGGRGIGLICDHSDDASVKEVFEFVRRDHGHLDVLVNNVFASPDVMPVNVPFWQIPTSIWDTLHRVGLRSHFVASQHAVPLMLPQKRGLIVNTSSGGGVRYTFNVPFGVQKSGVDRMARDMAHELQPFGIAAVSIWPGYIKSEKLAAQPDRVPPALAKLIAERGETPIFAGRAVAALASDPGVMAKSGQILLASELAAEYGFTDIDGKVPPPPSRDPAPLSVFTPNLSN